MGDDFKMLFHSGMRLIKSAGTSAKVNKYLTDDAELQKFSDHVFSTVDLDRTGFVEVPELKGCLEELCAMLGLDKPSDDDVQTSLSDLDTNKDGKISNDEFKVLVQQTLEYLKVSGDPLRHNSLSNIGEVAFEEMAEAPASARGADAEAPAPPPSTACEAPAPAVC